MRRVFVEGARSADPPISQGTFGATAFRTFADASRPATEPVAFAREILHLLGVYDGEVLDAWYRLFHDSDAEAYAVLEKAAGR